MLDNWDARFPEFAPVAYRLRIAFFSRWVRFHSLPESKRYPQDEEEYATVLDRQNCILEELVGAESKIILLTTEYSRSEELPDTPSEVRALDPSAEPWRSFPTPAEIGEFREDASWHVFASEWAWTPGVLDPILRLIAVDRVANVMIVAPDCRWIVHPYDGGTDVILETTSARDRLKAGHVDWLSPLESGL